MLQQYLELTSRNDVTAVDRDSYPELWKWATELSFDALLAREKFRVMGDVDNLQSFLGRLGMLLPSSSSSSPSLSSLTAVDIEDLTLLQGGQNDARPECVEVESDSGYDTSSTCDFSSSFDEEEAGSLEEILQIHHKNNQQTDVSVYYLPAILKSEIA